MAGAVQSSARLEIHGTEAAILVENHTSPDATVELVRDGAVQAVPTGPAGDPYLETVAAFAAAVAGVPR